MANAIHALSHDINASTASERFSLRAGVAADVPFGGDVPPAMPTCLLVDGDDLIAAVLIPDELDAPSATHRLADEIQDPIIQRVGHSWPQCPDHPHPLRASLRHGTAVWCCPDGPTCIAIGSYRV
jgi:hypothetical protein